MWPCQQKGELCCQLECIEELLKILSFQNIVVMDDLLIWKYTISEVPLVRVHPWCA